MAATSTIPDNLTREQYVYLAKLAEQAERYKEMVKLMEKLVIRVTPAAELTVGKRNLFSVAYKNVIDSLRAAWHIVSSIDKRKSRGRTTITLCLSRTTDTDLRLRTSFPMYAQEY